MQRKGQDVQTGITLAGKGGPPRRRESDDVRRSVSAAGAAGGITISSSGGTGSFEGEDKHDEVRAGTEYPADGCDDFIDDGGRLRRARVERDVGECGERGGGRAAEAGERGGVQVRHAAQEGLAKVYRRGPPEVVEQ